MSLSPGLRFAILRRDNFQCRYCGRHAPSEELHVDHVHPRSAGGSDRESNLVTACRVCNLGKGGRFVPPESSPIWSSLVGKFFHTLPDGRVIRDQGIILADLGQGYFVVERFQWITGSPSWHGTNVVHLSTMAADHWAFYVSQEEMHEAWQYGTGRPPITADDLPPPPTVWQRFLAWWRG